MNKNLKRVFGCSCSITMTIFTLIPESAFCKMIFKQFPKWINIVINRAIVFVIVVILVLLIYMVCIHIIKSIKIIEKDYDIIVEYGDILSMENCKKIIPFDECFTTDVGEKPAQIKPSSICGQYISKKPNINMSQIIENADVIPSKTKSKYKHKVKYESGTIIPNEDDLLMAFAKLDKDGCGYMTYDEYLDCLTLLWKEINKYYACKDVCVPILGSGITRFKGATPSQQELLNIMITSYKLSSWKIKRPYHIRFICKKTTGFYIYKVL